MDKIKCARCGYSEFNSSLHIHHIDLNHDNDDETNIMVLCSNCHYGLHHQKWDISDIVDITVSFSSNNNQKKKKPVTKHTLKKYIVKLEIKNKRDELKNSELKHEVKRLKKLIRYTAIKQSHASALNHLRQLIIFKYIHIHSYNLYDKLVELEDVFNAHIGKATMKQGKYRYNIKYPDPDMKKIFMEYVKDIKAHRVYLTNTLPTLVEIGDMDDEWNIDMWSTEIPDLPDSTIRLIQEHYATPSTAEMSEVAENKPVI